MGFENNLDVFKLDFDYENEEDNQGYGSDTEGSTILYGSIIGSSLMYPSSYYSGPWPRTYKETTDSLSIAASPSSISLIRRASSITQSIASINLGSQDVESIKYPLISDQDHKSKDHFDRIPSTYTWSTLGKPSCIQISQDQISYGCNVAQTVFNGFSVFVGIGLLSVPSTIQEAGWASMALFILYAGLCYFTGYLLRKCLERDTDIITFPDLGEAAFGIVGRIFVSIIFYIELYCSCVEFIMLEANNLARLFPNASIGLGGFYLTPVQSLGIVATLIILPSCFIRDFRKISFISAGNAIGAACIVISMITIAEVEDIGFHQTGPLVKWNGLPYALGVFGFCYSGHSVLPNLYHSMSNKKKFNLALTIIFALTAAVYLIVATSGFLMFGEETNSPVTLNLPPNSAISRFVLWITVAIPLFKYPLFLNPLARSLEELLPPEISDSSWFVIPLRFAIVVSSVCVAFLVPFFGYVMSFTGSLLCLLTSIVVPVLGYVKIVKNLSSSEIVTCYIVATVGIVVAILGTYSSVYDIIHSY